MFAIDRNYIFDYSQYISKLYFNNKLKTFTYQIETRIRYIEFYQIKRLTIYLFESNILFDF